MPETLPRNRRETGSLWSVFAGYRELLRNRQLVGFSAVLGFFYVGIFASIAGTPFAYICYHGLSPRLYALLFAAGVFGLMAANIVNARLVTRVGSNRMLLVGTVGAAVFGAAAALVTGTGWGGIYSLVPALFLFTSMNGLIAANAVAGRAGQRPDAHRRGIGAARRHPVRQRHGRGRGGRHLRRRHALADGLGHGPRRRREPRERPGLPGAKRARRARLTPIPKQRVPASCLCL